MKVKYLFLTTLAAAAAAFSACGSEGEESGIRVTGVSVNKSTLTLAVGYSETLTATVTPEDADNKNVTWASDNDAVATVNSATGEVSAVSKGLAIITVTTEDGGKADICTVTVGDVVPVTSVVLSDEEIDIEPGDTATLTVTVAPGKATNKNVTWDNSNEDVISYNTETGLITTLSEGRAVLTVTTEDGGFTAKCSVTVAIHVESLSVNKEAITLDIGESEVLEATVTPANATVKSAKWTSDKPEIASVHPTTGEVTGLSEGTAVITATSSDSGKTDICEVTVTDIYDPAGPVYNNVTGILTDVADPYVLKYDGKYYMYGTGYNSASGIKVYESDNLVNWSSAVGKANNNSGYAIHRNDVYGTSNYWAPEVYHLDNQFYMFFSVNERISVATSDSPLGPFTQTAEEQKVFHGDIWEIDTHLFIDDDGKKYLYFVRKPNGNYIYVAELEDDMRSIKESTLTECIRPSQNWEYQREATNEGPFILKYRDYYYLTYSGSHYETDYYGVGYAVATNPRGPWEKYSGNPILIGDFATLTGVGHHSFIESPSGALYMVYHSHNRYGTVQPRKAALDRAIFDNSTTPATLVIKGPSLTPQVLR